jgi:hypothetical protein
MGVESIKAHQRTGRPKGSKTTPPWVRAVSWAERNYGKPGAVPPNALAARILQMAQERPDLFVKCCALRDGPQQARPPKAPAPPAHGTPPAVAGAVAGRPACASAWEKYPSGGLKVVTIGNWSLSSLLSGQEGKLVGVPQGRVVDAWVSADGLSLLVNSAGLRRLPSGVPIPEESAGFEQTPVITVNGRPYRD